MAFVSKHARRIVEFDSMATSCRTLRNLYPLMSLLSMALDDLIQCYFATDDLSSGAPDAVSSGLERCRVDFGLEQDRGKRFALLSFLHMLGSAPDHDIAFEDEVDREVASNFMDLLAASQEAEEN